VLPDLKLRVPVGAAPPVGAVTLTVALNVTVVPEVTVFAGEIVTFEVEVVPLLTIWLTLPELAA
jgi:hypothetical protein